MSILHFNKQSLKRQQLFLSNPEEFTCQEKIDGTNFAIDIDDGIVSIEHGRYSILELSGWDNNFWTANYREAHSLIVQIKDQLIAAYGRNASIRSEILSVNYPNTLQYDNDINRIVIFKPLDVHFETDGVVDQFTYPATKDGVTTTYNTRTSTWKVSTLPTIAQTEWIDFVRNLTDNHYEEMLNHMVRNRRSMFGDTNVEGLVFTHRDGWMFKIVDREFFTARNTNNQALRRKLFRSSYMRDMTVMDIHTIDSRTDRVTASYTALQSINRLFDEYMADTTKTLDAWVHSRNLEAVASLRNQLNGIIHGR